MPLLTIKELEDASFIFRGKVGNAFARLLMKGLSVDKMNALYDRNTDKTGREFVKSVLDQIGVTYEVMNRDRLENIPEGAFITISNHPYGGIDGLVLVDIFASLRSDYNVMVNRILGRIETMKDNFICVTPNGDVIKHPTSASISGVKRALSHIRKGGSLGIFPSGAVSDLSIREGCVRDREWQEAVIRLIQKADVPVVPVTFLGGNSRWYYSLGIISWKVRLMRLPSELFNKRGKQVKVAIGEVISPEIIKSFQDIGSLSDFLRKRVYDQKKVKK